MWKKLTAFALCAILLCAWLPFSLAGEIETVEVSALLDQAQAAILAEDYETAVQLLQEAADQGDALAMYNLAFCYLEGLGAEQDAGKAEELLRACADQGDAVSQYMLGYCYYFGEVLKQDYEEAVKYLIMAADQEIAPAYYFLGMCSENGWGVEQNIQEALDYYQTGAEWGNDASQYRRTRGAYGPVQSWMLLSRRIRG